MTTHATIAVLPFSLVEAEESARVPDYLAHGIVNDVSNELARFTQLDVVHPDSAATARQDHDDFDGIAKAIHADWLVTGKLSRRSDEIEVEAALIELPGARQVWSERLSANADLRAIEREIAEAIAARLSHRIDDQVRKRARRDASTDLDAYDLYLRGMEELRGGSAEHDQAARDLFETALGRDPYFARAHAGISLSYFNDWSCQSWEKWDRNGEQAERHASRAVQLDGDDHIAHMILGRILQYHREFDRAQRHLDLAYALNPNDPDALMQLALSVAMMGDGERAHEIAERAMRLHQLHPDWYYGYAALAKFSTREIEAGIALARRAWGLSVDLPAHVGAGYAHLGDLERARENMEIFRREFVEKITFGREPEPGEAMHWILHVNPLRRKEDRDFLVEGLERAGLSHDPDRGRTSTASPRADSPTALFQKQGDVWAFAYKGRSVQLRGVKGFADLAVLLERPSERVHCVTLAGAPAEAHGGDDTLDSRARREIEARIRGLQEELDEAEGHHDLGRAERAREELDALVESLAKSLGLGGRSRKLGNAAEKARSAVTWRIRAAIGKIGEAHQELGQHLSNAVKTGAYCSYEPEDPPDWVF